MLKKHIKLNLSKHHITVSNEDKIKLETALDCMRQVAFSVKFEVCRVFESEV
jgi:ribosomal protein L28